MVVSFKCVGALALSAAALSFGMLAVVPAASAEPGTQHYSKIEARLYEHGVDCDELIRNWNPKVKHSRSDSKQRAECEKSKQKRR